METFNGIISVLLGFISLYLMFFKAQNDLDIISGFVVLLTSVIFMCFMLLEERKEEVEKLRQIIMREKGMIK